jgi:hypothetical protein
MKISEVEPGTVVTIKEGPAVGHKIRVGLQTWGNRVGVFAIPTGEGQVVRGDLEVEE